MKNLLYLFVMGAFAMLQACQGPQGPEGPPGPQGPQGPQGAPGQGGGGGNGLIATVFETDPFNFNAENEYMAFYEFDTPIELTDKLIGYILWDDEDVDIWRMMPQTVFVDQGIFKYDFDFTSTDFQIFMDGNFDLGTLGTEWTDNQVFRILVIPADFPAGRLDYSNFEEVLKHFEISEEAIIKGQINLK